MFETVLVADRGVPALHVVRSCQRLGVQAVAVHADDDGRAPHARQADEVVPLGGTTAQETYADGRKVLEAARRSGAQAVHPGAGALALDAGFARSVLDAGLVWLGPPPALLGRPVTPPAAARRLVVVLLGSQGEVVQCLGRRERVGRMVDLEPATLSGAAAQHVLDSAAGWAVDAGPFGVLAVDVALTADGAVPVGAVPLAGPGAAATGLVAGQDLVELQLRLAAGEPPPEPAHDRPGAAVSLQVRAAERFAGRLRRFRMPSVDDVRTDCAVAEGERFTAGRSRLLAVVTASGRDREQAVARARDALARFEVRGVPTDLPLLADVLADPSFVAGVPDTALLERTRTA